MRFDRKQIAASFKAVRRQLTSDHIDHYQLHWPDRATNDFGRLGYRHEDGAAETPIEETLDALDAVVQAGKVRHVGLSNEQPWGVMRLLEPAGQGRGQIGSAWCRERVRPSVWLSVVACTIITKER